MTGEDIASIEAWERRRGVIGATVIPITIVVKLAILEVERESLWEERDIMRTAKEAEMLRREEARTRCLIYGILY